MEIKDLLLLLLIPVLLIGILSYADSITGAAIAEKSNKIGEYSVLPSFKVHTDYNLGEYKDLKIKLKNIIDLCKDENMEKCLEREAEKLKWKCDDKEEKIIYKFADSLRDCSKIDGRAVCKFSFNDIKGINDNENERIFDINLINSDGNTKMELREGENIIAEDSIGAKELIFTDYDTKDTSKNNTDSINIRIKYTDEKPEIQKFFAVKNGKEIKLSNELAYKSDETIRFIDANFENSFRAPEPANKMVKMPITRGMKFCAKSGKEVFIYENGKLNKKRITYKFSVTFPKPIPPPVENFEATDAPKAEKSSVLVWDSDEQAAGYNIYYSTASFIDIPMKDIKNDNSILKISLNKKNAIEIDDIILSECAFDPYGERCKYSLYGKSLEPGKLYYWKSNGRYIYYLAGINDGNQYHAAVTAIDDEGNEIDNDKTKTNNKMIFTEGKNFRQVASKDDLAPMKIADLRAEGQKLLWTKPLKNADGNDAADITYFNVYYKKSATALSPNIESGYITKRINVIEANCASQAISCEFSVASIPNLEKQIYSFAVTALDENLNEVSEADVKQLLIT